MGIGHLGASFALRARFPRVPFFFLLAAGVLVDVFWGIAILSGLENARIDTGSGSVVPLVLEHVPFTHSLPACLLWAALASLGWWIWRRDRAGALVLGALVLSHWVLDLVSHVGDIPLLPAGPLVGLGLWRSRGASLVVELGLFAVGLLLYVRGTAARDRTGSVGILIAGAVLSLGGAGAFLGPPAASVLPLAAGNLALVLVLLLLDWIDRHRTVKVARSFETATGLSA